MSLIDQINTKTTINFPEGAPDVQVPVISAGVAEVTINNLLTFIQPAQLTEDITINLKAGAQLRAGARVIIITESGATSYRTDIAAADGNTVKSEGYAGKIATTRAAEFMYTGGVFYQVSS